MTRIALFHLVDSHTATVMETMMKRLLPARRPAARLARWLAAAGIALASLTAVAHAETATPVAELDESGSAQPGIGSIRPFFEKVGSQLDCNTVTYTLRFGLRASPAVFGSPGIEAWLPTIRFDLSDQLPTGLTVTDVTASGDGMMAGGGALSPTIATTADPNDSAKLDDFRLTAADQEASGEADSRYIIVKITAKIDPGAFPAPTLVDNQAWVRATRAGGGSTIDIPSHDPSLPDDADFRTGEKTKILIDLTGCTPPPPPPGGDEPQVACFKIEEGEVDCVPGGGAFIYNMPFGADMGSKVVQLKTTTPGITIAPASQFVPAGGGSLAWTITGAAPGDVVKLIVVGVDTYAGPAEGVGICCTQTIDLVIPADLDCPDEEKQPDLKVEKKADVAFCTKEGGCDFTITVTNAGDAPYNGKIVLDEVTAPGSATVSSGPNDPWTCLPGVSPLVCEHPETTLNPGESKELKLGFTPGPAWNWGAIRNCAEFDYTASGFTEPFGDTTNDKACASIPICIPGIDAECTPDEDQPKVDLTIRKIASPVLCTEDGVCNWQIVILNPTTETFNGPLTIKDEFTTHTPVSVNFEPTGPWVCAPVSGTEFQCDHPGLVLVGGAATILTVEAVIGDTPIREVENCGDIVPFPDELDTTNNHSCATATLPEPEDAGEPRMSITKTCDAAVAGAAISCRITVSNTGTAAPLGTVRVNDAAELIGAGTPVSIQTVSPDGPEWTCGAVPSDSLACEIPGAVMTPGTSRHFDATLAVSPNERFENCARGSYGPAPGNDIVYPIAEACDQGGASIKVEKTGQAQCLPGEACTFEITITNTSDSNFSGQVRIGDAIEIEGVGRLEGVPISSIVPPFGCAEEPTTLPLSCLADLSLSAGESRTHTVTVVIPTDGPYANMDGPIQGRNCVAVLSPETPVLGAGGGVSRREVAIDPTGLGDAYSCHSFVLLQQDIKPQTKECSPGFTLNADGRCVCPEGSTFRNGKCSAQQTKVPTPRPQADPKPEPKPDPVEPPARSCKVKGQVRVAGKCECPKGTEVRNGACRRIIVEEQPPVRQCKLLPGMIRTKAGECVCPRGTKLSKGECRKPTVECRKGTTLKNGKCVAVEPQCRKGQVLRGGKCVDLRCPKGTTGTPPNCREVKLRIPNLNVIPKLVDPNRRQPQPKVETPIIKARPGATRQ